MVAGELFASAVEVDITPPVGAGMDGYAARRGGSLGVHDPLLGQLLLLASGGSQVALVSLDLIGAGLDFTRQVREGITQAIGVAGDHILVACTHTHSGAAGFMPPHPGISTFQDPQLQELTARKLVGAALWAKQGLRPARLGSGQGVAAGIGLNRNDPENGPVDNQVTVLLVEDLEGAPLAVATNFGCHPTVLGHQNLYFSADFPGAARATLKKIYPEAVFLFTNGASGDVSARFTRRDQSFAEVGRMGRLLAGETLKVMQTIQPGPKARLHGAISELELKFRPYPTPEAARLEVERLQAELEALKASGAPHGEIRRALTRVEGATGQALVAADMAADQAANQAANQAADQAADKAKEFGGRTSARIQIQALSIGDLALVGLPGEPFTRTVLEIKAASPKPLTAVVSYANDYRGYFPDAVSIEAGDYEARISPYGADAANALRQGALEILRQ